MLGHGGHVANDVPPLPARFRAQYPRVQLRLLPMLSALPGMTNFIADAVARDADE